MSASREVPAPPGDRRALVAQGWAHAAELARRCRAAEMLYPSGEWPDRQRDALDAARRLVVFLREHPTDPIAQVLLGATSPEPGVLGLPIRADTAGSTGVGAG